MFFYMMAASCVLGIFAELSTVIPVFAVEESPKTTEKSDSSATTTGKIVLQENKEKSTPKNPEDPSEEAVVPDGNNPVTNNVGPLSLDVAPYTFDFGKQPMYMAAHTYYAEGGFEQYLQVTDNRAADISGWQVTVKQDGDLKNETETLTGAVITVPAGTPRNSLADDPKKADTNLVANEVKVDDDEQTVFGTQKKGAGKDVSVDTWLAKDVSLNIPADTAREGAYSSTLTWTLTAAATD